LVCRSRKAIDNPMLRSNRVGGLRAGPFQLIEIAFE
jgi:hypothetical protein